MSINEKLVSIQNELKAPKSCYNKFGNFRYRNAEDILEAVKPLTLKNKTVLYLTDEVVQIGIRYYIKAVATLSDCESDACISVCAYAREEENKKGMDCSQVTGASSSYARKYALNGLFCIDDTKDADGIEKVETEVVEDKPVDDEKIENLRAKLFAQTDNLKWYTTPPEVKERIIGYAKERGITLTQEYIDKSLTAYAEKQKG